MMMIVMRLLKAASLFIAVVPREPARSRCCKTQAASVVPLLEASTAACASGWEKNKKKKSALLHNTNMVRTGIDSAAPVSLWRQQAVPVAPVPAGSCWCAAWCSPAWCRRSAWTRTGAWSPPARSARWAGCSCGQRGCRHWRTPPGSEIDRNRCLQPSM